MKTIILLFSLISFNAHAGNTCYPFQPNQDGYSKVCIQFENPTSENTNAVIDVYKSQTIVHRLPAVRFYSAAHTSCSGKEHDCRNVKSQLSIVTPTSNGNGIEMFIQLWQPAPEKCRSGSFTLKNRPYQYLELYLECSKTWW